MTEPLEALYIYAQENMVLPLLKQEPDYRHACQCVEKLEEQLRALLDEKASLQLEKLLKAQVRLAFICEQSVFQAGFRLALGLMWP